MGRGCTQLARALEEGFWCTLSHERWHINVIHCSSVCNSLVPTHRELIKSTEVKTHTRILRIHMWGGGKERE